MYLVKVVQLHLFIRQHRCRRIDSRPDIFPGERPTGKANGRASNFHIHFSKLFFIFRYITVDAGHGDAEMRLFVSFPTTR